MENFYAAAAETWALVQQGNEELRKVAYYATFATLIIVFCNIALWWRSWRPVAIVAVNDDSPARPKESRVVGELPRRAVTRAEVMGFVAQAAGGATLDFKRFRFDYRFKRRVFVALPEASYGVVTANEPA